MGDVYLAKTQATATLPILALAPWAVQMRLGSLTNLSYEDRTWGQCYEAIYSSNLQPFYDYTIVFYNIGI